VQQLASPDELYERPENAFVAYFIGENNRLVGEVSEHLGDNCKVRLDSGDTVIAKPIAVGDVGSRTTLSLRPERVSILSGDAEEQFDNQFTATVQEAPIHAGADVEAEQLLFRLDARAARARVAQAPPRSTLRPSGNQGAE
jgi:ABC-type Fe3+/spermidine/putrescine transport system ATPase subunit